ncbi:TnpV protein [Massilimicrobiota timonensis]|uniref:TnpV protein n=1 Tax=Massilimicrobiota timonensis TaxID=1776392 RepID=UPI00101CFFE9|nr:TnpV protein [Massilimicrobiota timonensis]
MDKYIYDDKNGLWYELQGDYYIPCLILPAEKEQPIGLWGQRHLRYLKEYRRATYITLFTSGRLNNYLADIDRQAQERMERLTEQMKRVQGITEQLKAENALEWTHLEWTQRMNNIRACAKEIVEKEIIFA